MHIDKTDANEVSGFYIVDFNAFAQTLGETHVAERMDLGTFAVIRGTRNGAPIWMIDNPAGRYPIWVEEGA